VQFQVPLEAIREGYNAVEVSVEEKP